MDRAFALDLRRRHATPTGRRAGGRRAHRPHRRRRRRRVGRRRSRPAPSCSPPAATGRSSPARRTRRRSPATGWRWRCAPGSPSRDVEFVQFHPTVLWRGPDAVGQQALISEAVRGEGAILYDAAGERVMAGVHPQEDLAPRDVVAAAISRRMAEAPAGVDDHVYLDATHMGERFYERFPAITAACRAIGIDPARDRIPVAPAAHYVCGGVRRRPRRAHRAGRPVRRRRGARAPACTAPTGSPATASPRASSPAPASGATWRGSCPTAVDAVDRRRRRATPVSRIAACSIRTA